MSLRQWGALETWLSGLEEILDEHDEQLLEAAKHIPPLIPVNPGASSARTKPSVSHVASGFRLPSRLAARLDDESTP